MRLKLVLVVMGLVMMLTNFAFAKAISSISSLDFAANDTIAGFSTLIEAKGAKAGDSAWLIVQNPLGEQTKVELSTSRAGSYRYQLAPEATEVSGEYLFAFTDGRLVSDIGRFLVFPGAVDVDASNVSPKNLYLPRGDIEKVKVDLFDEFENPIEGHLVKLIADDDVVRVESDTGLSDDSGSVYFNLSMLNNGVASFSVYDVTADKLLATNLRVASSDDLPMGNASGVIDSFEFEDVPEEILAGENFSLKLVAKDAKNETVFGYDGTVRFTIDAEDGNSVVLPDDYQFEISDQGEHVFSLAFLFQKAGDYHLTATDLDNLKVVGEIDLVVKDSSGIDGEMDGIRIVNPIAGTFSNNIQVISGNAPAGSKLKIFDNEVELTSMIVGSSGNFSFTTAALEDGEHQVYVATVNDVGTIIDTSAVIGFTIDTFAPEISRVVIEPAQVVVPGTPVKVKLYTDSDLAGASVVFEDNIYEFAKNAAGYFEVSLVAPNEVREYPLEFVLKDKLGNESRVSDLASLEVSNLIGEGVVPTVEGLVAKADSNRVVLNWATPAGATSEAIQNYRVYFGLAPNQLTQAVDTLTNATTWYVPNLQNGTQYYFAVIAVTENGDVSDKFSNVVAAVPGMQMATLPPNVVHGTAGSEVFEEDGASEVSGTGPEMGWLIVVSCVAGLFYCNMRPWKRRKL